MDRIDEGGYDRCRFHRARLGQCRGALFDRQWVCMWLEYFCACILRFSLGVLRLLRGAALFLAVVTLAAFEEGNLLRSLYPGEQLEVVGHNGGVVDNGRWWLVKYGSEDRPTFGWVASSVVAEINPGICSQLTQYPVN